VDLVPRSFTQLIAKLPVLAWFKTDEKILLQLGRMVPRKGVDNVVRSLGKLKNSGEKYRLVVVGGETDDPNPMAVRK
jgi:glycosyltransferase involved in cell wall biosynthesis